jgi:hypothetical protein
MGKKQGARSKEQEARGKRQEVRKKGSAFMLFADLLIRSFADLPFAIY